MNGLEIHDMQPRGVLAFDLKEIALCLGEETLNRQWTCSGVECVDDSPIDAVANSSSVITGAKLIELAEKTSQVIDGTFRGQFAHEPTPSLVIVAIDSTHWEVFGPDSCLERIRTTFRDVRPAQYSWD